MSEHHTPGPWYVRGRYSDGLYEIHDSDKENCIAFTHNLLDAYLISAAPALLASLEEFVGVIERLEEEHGLYEDREALRDARTAIAKATTVGKDRYGIGLRR